VGFLQIGDGQLGVMFEGVQALMAQQLLHVVYVRAATNHFGGAASPKGVRSDMDPHSGGQGLANHRATKGVIGHALSVPVQEERFLPRPRMHWMDRFVMTWEGWKH